MFACYTGDDQQSIAQRRSTLLILGDQQSMQRGSTVNFHVKSRSPLLILGGDQWLTWRGSTVNFHFCMKSRLPLLIGGGIDAPKHSVRSTGWPLVTINHPRSVLQSNKPGKEICNLIGLYNEVDYICSLRLNQWQIHNLSNKELIEICQSRQQSSSTRSLVLLASSICEIQL